MQGFAKFAAVVSIPLSLLNMLGGIVAGIWLAILGKWSLIGYGLLAVFVSGFGLGLAMMPGLLFAAPAAALYEKGHKLGSYFFGFLSALYTMAVLTVWCMAVLLISARQAESNSIIPVLLWSYGVATGPIGWMAQKEAQSGGGVSSTISAMFSQIAYVLVVLAVLLFGVSLGIATILFGMVMVIGLIVQISFAVQMEGLTRQASNVL